MPIRERTIVDIREEMAKEALGKNANIRRIAEEYGVTPPTVRLWRDRFRQLGSSNLVDRSHAPHSCPHKTSEDIEQLIVEDAKANRWGSKKILRRLHDAHPELDLPARSTVDEILKRHELTVPRRKRDRKAPTPFRQRYEPTEPAELFTIDHKGQFRLRNGRYCYPLTIVDSVSRYILGCEALSSTKFLEAWPIVERTFREYGLPVAMQSDNGPPFGTSIGLVSNFSVQLMMYGVLPVFSRPGKPQDNGKHERMHRELKRELTRPPAASLLDQQGVFRDFCRRYNFERPHEGIDMERPAKVFRASPRPFPKRRPKPEYALHFEKRKVSPEGCIKWQNARIFLGQPLGGQTIAIELEADALCSIYFYQFRIGRIDERTKKVC